MMNGEATATGELQRFRLDGRVMLVTGGYGGIGSRLCRALAGVGARVVVIGRDAAHAQAGADAISQSGGEALVAVADATKRDQIDGAVDAAVEHFGRVDGLVDHRWRWRGRGPVPGRVLPRGRMELDHGPQLALGAAFRTSCGAGDDRGRARRPHLAPLVVRGQLGINNGFSAYVAAKGALDALTRQQATEWAHHRITVNAISPTFVRTPQVAGLLSDTAFREGLERRIPLGRIAETDDVVGAALLLCSDASSFITGQVLTLDGGLTACQ